MNFTNENLLGLTLDSFTFIEGEFLFNRIKNRLLTNLMLNIENYKNIFRYIGKTRDIDKDMK
jgi:hypothetical protein